MTGSQWQAVWLVHHVRVPALLLDHATKRLERGTRGERARQRPSPREPLATERFAGLVGAGNAWRMEPGWRGQGGYRTAPFGEPDRGGVRPGYRPGGGGSWRPTRGSAERGGSRGPASGGAPVADRGSAAAVPDRSWGDAPFVAGDIADRGPLERADATAVLDIRARDARELERQRAWRDQASKAITALKADEGTGPVNADDLAADDEALADRARAEAIEEEGEALHVPDAGSLPTLRVFPHGISRKRLEQAIRELQLPVIVARDIDEADVVMTLRSEYRQKTPALREAEERSMPIYVLKSNTILQMQASLTSVFALEIDPREAALRETEEAIGIVLQRSEAVELSPQNAYIRRLQHQMAERANLVSRSRGREPYRRVRLYPDAARSSWR